MEQSFIYSIRQSICFPFVASMRLTFRTSSYHLRKEEAASTVLWRNAHWKHRLFIPTRLQRIFKFHIYLWWIHGCCHSNVFHLLHPFFSLHLGFPGWLILICGSFIARWMAARLFVIKSESMNKYAEVCRSIDNSLNDSESLLDVKPVRTLWSVFHFTHFFLSGLFFLRNPCDSDCLYNSGPDTFTHSLTQISYCSGCFHIV